VSGGGGDGSGSTTSCLRGLRLRWEKWLLGLERFIGGWFTGFRLILLFSGHGLILLLVEFMLVLVLTRFRLILLLVWSWLILVIARFRLVLLILLGVVLLGVILFRSGINLRLSGVSGIYVII
jgi:hypothetical protein